ncbi:hypothetical protein [Anaerocolumna jejuensis]|uniref:hypothetical protein n=1 Tax=Anaerocolumna jejuensis TaxID=259063 RepID=UPI003F7B4802
MIGGIVAAITKSRKEECGHKDHVPDLDDMDDFWDEDFDEYVNNDNTDKKDDESLTSCQSRCCEYADRFLDDLAGR